eukprot:UN01120
MQDPQIHWFSIMNSFMIVLFLSGMVAMILMRALHKDFRRYNQDDPEALEAQQEETGWKLVHGDVFRPPEYKKLLCIFHWNWRANFHHGLSYPNLCRPWLSLTRQPRSFDDHTPSLVCFHGCLCRLLFSTSIQR